MLVLVCTVCVVVNVIHQLLQCIELHACTIVLSNTACVCVCFEILCIVLFTCCRPCLCGVKDAGCFWCGVCRRCANVELPPGHPLQQHATWTYASARERVRNLFTASYKGPMPLTGQGEVADHGGGKPTAGYVMLLIPTFSLSKVIRSKRLSVRLFSS